jgi:hypothetical protein
VVYKRTDVCHIFSFLQLEFKDKHEISVSVAAVH